MPISYQSPYRRPVFTTVAVLLAAVSLTAAWQQSKSGATRAGKGTASLSDARDGEGVPPPDPALVDTGSGIEMPPVELVSREEHAARRADQARRRRTGDSEWMNSGVELAEAREESGTESAGSAKKSAIELAGFEEEIPPAPETDDDEQVTPRARRDARDKIARKPVDSLKASAAAPPADEDDPLARHRLLKGEQIQTLVDDGDYIAAQAELSHWFWQKPEARSELLPQLHKLSRALYFSPQPHYYEPYVVKPGDQLRVIGQKYKVPWEYLAKLNQVDARKIRAGQKLKVVPGPFGVIVFLDRFELVVHLHGSYVKSYKVGIGKDGKTPVGVFPVKNKMADPTYYGPEGVIAHDDPQNPLGERWIDIGDSFGIHGTIEPDSIGKKESRGCVRMLNSDVEEVYDFLVVGSEVRIVRK